MADAAGALVVAAAKKLGEELFNKSMCTLELHTYLTQFKDIINKIKDVVMRKPWSKATEALVGLEISVNKMTSFVDRNTHAGGYFVAMMRIYEVTFARVEDCLRNISEDNSGDQALVDYLQLALNIYIAIVKYAQVVMMERKQEIFKMITSKTLEKNDAFLKQQKNEIAAHAETKSKGVHALPAASDKGEQRLDTGQPSQDSASASLQNNNQTKFTPEGSRPSTSFMMTATATKTTVTRSIEIRVFRKESVPLNTLQPPLGGVVSPNVTPEFTAQRNGLKYDDGSHDTLDHPDGPVKRHHPPSQSKSPNFKKLRLANDEGDTTDSAINNSPASTGNSLSNGASENSGMGTPRPAEAARDANESVIKIRPDEFEELNGLKDNERFLLEQLAKYPFDFVRKVIGHCEYDFEVVTTRPSNS